MANPAFQFNAFQVTAFQTSHSLLVAPTYSLGSPAFATPALVEVLAVSSWSLGAPAFATPPITVLSLALPAVPLTLGSPVYGAATLRQTQFLNPRSLALSPLDFGNAAWAQDNHLFSNDMALSALSFATPGFVSNYVLAASGYTLASPQFGGSNVTIIGHALVAPAWSLEAPRYAMPRLQVAPSYVPMVPFYKDQTEEAAGVLNRMLDDVMASVPSPWNPDAYQLRRQVGDIRANALQLIRDQELGDPLWQAFETARTVGATLEGMDCVREHQLALDPAPHSPMAKAVAQAGILFALITESKIVADMTFKSREDVQAMIVRMNEAFEQVKNSETIDSTTYRRVIALGGALMYHLGQTELQLPRHVKYVLPAPQPALYVANRIYADASRYEEIVEENKIVHPAFCPRELNVLSLGP